MPSPEHRSCHWSFLGRQPYQTADRLQRTLRDRVRQTGDVDFLILLEHPHVYTLGRNADHDDILVDEDWLRSKGAEVLQSDRGGKVTYHGPGQLVGYPIVDLSPDRRDLRRYVRDLQEVLVRTLADFGVESEPRHRSEEIGIWVEDRKIASLGVHVSRWITTHGFALNVRTDLSYFAGIVPCGLQGVEMASVESLGGHPAGLAEIAVRCVEHFGDVFERQMSRVEPAAFIEPWPIDS